MLVHLYCALKQLTAPKTNHAVACLSPATHQSHLKMRRSVTRAVACAMLGSAPRQCVLSMGWKSAPVLLRKNFVTCAVNRVELVPRQNA